MHLQSPLVDEINKIDFNEVLETSVDTLRKSVDEQLTFVKYNGEMPDSVEQLETKQGPYSHYLLMVVLMDGISIENIEQIEV